MELEDLGYTESLADFRKEEELESFDVGRVVSEHKDRYTVKTASDEYDAELIGGLRFGAESRYDLPAVGDWVAISVYDEGKALIHSLFPRHSFIERQAVGKSGQIQLIATNIDYGLIVLAVNRDFSINRLERYLTICNASKIDPVIILSKIDLIEETELNTLLEQIMARIDNVPVIGVSSVDGRGLDQISGIIESGKTYCLLGSSGVGKSTILNKLTGEELMETGDISESIDRGKHITSHRELIVLESGGIVIDNPGMREVGITDSSEGLEVTFDSIIKLSENCRFKDCTHVDESGCSVIEAVENGDLDSDSYANFMKMERERSHFESTVEERRQKDKSLSKLIRNVKKVRKNTKF